MKKATSLGWEFLIPLILALIVFLAMFGPGVTWVKDSWKKLSGMVGSLWKRETPKTVDPNTQTQFDAFNKALRDSAKIYKKEFTHTEFVSILNNMEFLQEVPEQGNVKAYLIKTTPDSKRPLYLIYWSGTAYVGQIVGNFPADVGVSPADDTHSYSLSEATAAYNGRTGGNTWTSLVMALSYECQVDYWFDYNIQMRLENTQDCCSKFTYCPNVKMKEKLEALIAIAPKR
jgi:hypothetical protein